MTWASTIPAAMSALAGAVEASGARVLVGPVLADAAVRPTIVIGWNGPSQDGPIVTANAEPGGFVTNPTHESYIIRCVAVVDSGSTSAEAVTATCDRAMGLFGSVVSVVAADKTLGGMVMRAGVADYSLSMQQGPRGLTAFVEFGIAVDAISRKVTP